LDEQLLHAYRNTDYRVRAHTPFSLRIGEHSAVCDELMAAHGVQTAAFITAWNPLSQSLNQAENDAAQSRLAADLATLTPVVLQGEGEGLAKDWPPEPSLFALGLSRAEATALAQKNRQNAYVWVTRGRPAELVICV
jgi:hypothetical protein